MAWPNFWRAAGVTVVEGEARFNRPHRVVVRTPADAAIFFEFEQAMIATGARNRKFPRPPVRRPAGA